MKINETTRIAAIHTYRQQHHEQRTAENGKNMRKLDEIEISAEAKELHDARHLEGAERRKRIEELKQSVSAGTYHVDSRALAEKLLRHLQDDSNRNG
jgi:negative regulator of flagellin synthesis FlgM